ncbi:putative nuclease HARBI1 [Ambystoma mexicanum]|uniref:putative nuclease HARBI1 n=1 Tax=Ambystoma mexicanum TaxID=8296 RepID=UPI0037E82E8F
MARTHEVSRCESGYVQLTWLMTPVQNPQTPQEVAYNGARIQTKLNTDWTFGLLKACFQCLHWFGGALIYRPEKKF